MSKSEWEIISVDRAADDSWHAWDCLNAESNGGTPILDSRFLRPICEAYAERGLAMAMLWSSGRLVSAMLVHPSRLREWQVFTAGQSCVGSILRSKDLTIRDLEQQICGLLPHLGKPVRIQLPKQDPQLLQCAGLSESTRFSESVYGVTTAIDVSQTFEKYWSSTHKEVRRGIRKAMNSLDSRGLSYRLEVRRDPNAISEAIDIHGRLESAGWKGDQGTAIRAGNEQGRCYQRILCNFGSDGARTYQLYFGEDVVASLLTVVNNSVQVVLKTAYNQDYADYSPGRFIDYLMISQVCEDETVAVIENYTVSKPADRRWATSTRPIMNVEFYRSAFTRRVFRHLSTLRKRMRST